jgi:hypothetical protein
MGVLCEHMDVKPTMSVNSTVADAYNLGGTLWPALSCAAIAGGIICRPYFVE